MKLIQLTQNQQVAVSDEDADLGNEKWCASFNPRYSNGGTYVAVRHTYRVLGKRKFLQMHRVILARMLGRELVKGELVDHIDTNTLNNQRENLRLATNAQNQRNKRISASNTTGYKGVSYHEHAKKYRADITVDRKLIYLGYFKTAEEAHEAYKAAAVKYHGEFARFE